MSIDLIASIGVAIIGFVISGLIGMVIYFLNQKMGSVDTKIDSIDSKLGVISKEIEQEITKIKIDLITKVSEIDANIGDMVGREIESLNTSKEGFHDIFSSVGLAIESLKSTIRIVKDSAEQLDKIDIRILSKIEVAEEKIKVLSNKVTVVENDVKGLGKIIFKK